MSAIEQRLIALREMSRAQVAMLEELLAGMQAPPEPPPSTECEHPEESRVSTARMGAPNAYHCRKCGQEVNGGITS